MGDDDEPRKATDSDADPDVRANVAAAVARSIVQQSMMMLTGFGKGLLKWWFRVPAKLFRPSAVNPLMLFAAMAEQDGRKVSVNYVRSIVKDEGWRLLSRNTLPLLLCNSLVGAVLFNTYSVTMSILEADSDDGNHSSLHPHHQHNQPLVTSHAFVSGALAGGAQTLLSTPLDNLTRRVDAKEVVARRANEGVLGLMKKAYREGVKERLAIKGHDRRRLWQSPGMEVLYEGWRVTAFKEVVGFALFFGFFENARKVGKRGVAELHSWMGWPMRRIVSESGQVAGGVEVLKPTLSLTIGNVAAVVAGGSLAGFGYQSIAYPLERAPSVIASHLATTSSSQPATSNPRYVDWKSAWEVVRLRGLRPFYSGIAAQLVRVAPPSAVGLLIFEVANSQLWDD